MKLRINEQTGIVFWIIGMLFFPYILRNRFLPETFAALNIISMLGVGIMVRQYYGGNPKMVFSRTFLALAGFVLIFVHSSGLSGITKVAFSVFLPLFVLDLLPMKKESFASVFPIVLRLFNVLMAFMTVCGLIDIFTHWRISQFFATFYATRSLMSMLHQGRLVSFHGHSLLTAEFVMAFLILHLIDEFYVRKKHRIVVPTIASVFLMAITGSKTGIVLMAALLLLFYGSKKTLKYLPLLGILLFGLWRMGVFDILYARITYGIAAGDVTTGRLTAFFKLFQSGAIQFEWFDGHDSDLINSSSMMIAALENPFMRWAFLYGIVFAAIMGARVVLLPLIELISFHCPRLLICAIIYILFINVFDSICSIGDGMLRYCTVLYFIRSAMNYLKEETL